MGQPGSHTLLENRKLYPKIQNSEFEKFLRKNYLNDLNFCAENHDFNQKHDYQKMKKKINFYNFLARKFKI